MAANKRRTGLAAVVGATAIAGGLALWSRSIARRAEALVPPDGSFVDVDDLRLHYIDRGNGRPVVLIHGLGGQLRNFDYGVIDSLAGEFRVIAVDRPGSGYSTGVSAARSNVRAQAAIIAAFIERLGLERPLIVGHSLGGAIALALAVDHADKISGIVALAPLSQPQLVVPEAFKALAIASTPLRAALHYTLSPPLSVATEAKILKLVFAPDPVPADFPVRGGGALTRRPSNLQAASNDLNSANADLDDLVAAFPAITLPVAILFGREDNLLDPETHGRKTADVIPGAQYRVVEGGHMLPVTHVEETIALIRSRVTA